MTDSTGPDRVDDIPANPSAEPTLGELIRRRCSRRQILKGSLGAAAMAALPGLPGAARAARDGGERFAFQEIAHGVDETHHVATGYGTDFVGEAEVSAWECRAGLRNLGPYTGAIVLGLALAGLAVAPVRTLRAFRASRGSSLFQDRERAYGDLLALRLAELRRQLGLPETGLAAAPRRLHPGAPTVEDRIV